VRSAAAGKVSKVIANNGQVHIEHPMFDGKARYETIYAHMSDIAVKPLEWVSAQQRIGRIGSTYYGANVISPHLHHQHRRKGEPVKMRLYVGGKVVPITISKADGGKRPQRESGTIAGWVQPSGLARARLSLRTRDAETQELSRPQRLFFRIAAAGQELPEEPFAANAEEATDGEVPMIAITYDGPQLDPGDYSVRYRAVSDAGGKTPWGYDHSLVVEQPLA
jgi:murein DD-endopeptidase MepM/ murein hydrolase activator NlpD